MVGSKLAGVSRVMSLGISSRVYPTASLAAILAIGKPVALEANADERDTLGFISTTTSEPSSGSTANWMLEPPVSTPISRMMAIAASRISWYSLSVNVCAGATGVEVLDRTDDHDVVGRIAHYLELVLLPPENALLDQALVTRRLLQSPFHHPAKLGLRLGHPGTRSPERKARPHDGRQTRFADQVPRFA